MRLAFKSVESYSMAENECQALLAAHKACQKAEMGGGIAATISFRPGAKKPPSGKGAADDDVEFPLLEKPLSDGPSGELKKLETLLAKVSQLKEEAIEARDAAGKAEKDEAVSIE